MDNIWLKQYDKGVPSEIKPDSFASLVELFEKSCKKYSDKPAVSCMDCTLSYEQLMTLSRSFAAYLQNELRVKKGDRIALMMPNILQYPVALFGALMTGAVIVNVNSLYTAPELVKQLTDSGAETIVVLANFAHVLQHALPETRVRNVIVTEVGDLCGMFKSLLVNFMVNKVKKKVPEWYIPYAVSFRKVMEFGHKLRLQKVRITGDDLAILQYTGGTTGVSKGAMLTHRNILANVLQNAAWMGGNLQEGVEVSITALPLYHVFALTVCCFTFLYFGAESVLIINPRDLNSVSRAIDKHKVTVLIGVNSLFNALLNTSEFKKLDFGSVKFTIAGGMAVQSVVADRWKEITGSNILEGYGLTEASPVVTMNPLTQKDFINSIGLPIPSTLISIRDDDGKELSVGEEGELCVKGPQVMQGYWESEAETENVFWEDGWLRTGDVAVMDEQGYFYIVDRKKDIIVTSGYNVYPNEIESVLMTHPLVKEVAIVGVPHEHAGELVKAFIVRKDDSLMKDKVVAFCKDRLTSYKVPKRVEFRDELPKSNVGKILRRALREEG
ncbi:MAG: AMP-binding protein [Gammaproteobacteria bacterium]|nr:AMP-binding protein [Gammaproteobacteria bacterium]